MECPSFKRLLELPPLYSAKTHVGRRLYNEDRYTVSLDFIDMPLEHLTLQEIIPKAVAQLFPAYDPCTSTNAKWMSSGQLEWNDVECFVLDTFHLFCVFDGHGGDDASEFLAKNVAKYVQQELHVRLQNCPPPQKFLRLSTVPPNVLLSNVQEALKEIDLDDIPDEEEYKDGEQEGDEESSLFKVDQRKNEQRALCKQAPGSLRPPLNSKSPADDLSKNFCEETTRLARTTGFFSGARSFSNGTNMKNTRGITTAMIESALSKSMTRLDEDFGKIETSHDSGSTAVVVLLSNLLICVANIGDSRAVLCRRGKPLPLTRDHTPSCRDEVERVSKAGGHIVQMAYDGPRVMGVLNMTRAVGDHSLRPYVIATTETAILRRQETDEFLVIASDGLWGEIPVEDCCALVQKCLVHGHLKGISRQAAVKLAANVLVRRVIDKGGADNVTVVVVDLKKENKALR